MVIAMFKNVLFKGPSTTLVDPDIPLDPVKPGTSYEELRKRNREEYAKRQQSPFSKPLPPDAPVIMRQSDRSSSSGEEAPNTRSQKNKYGDDLLE